MEFHPGKCQLLRITNKISPLKHDYQIHNTVISETDAARYLGVVIDSKLSWKHQYNSLLLKCNHTLAFIRRNLSKCPPHIKNRCYTALVRPTLDYACAIWDPHNQIDIDNLEKIQKRAGRFVTGNYQMVAGNSELNRKQLGWETLEERRLHTKLTIFQKSRLKLLDIPTDHLQLKKRLTRHEDGPCFTQSHSNVDSHKFSFYPSTTLLWNCLPSHIKACDDINIFTKEIKNCDLLSFKHNVYLYSTQSKHCYFN